MSLKEAASEVLRLTQSGSYEIDGYLVDFSMDQQKSVSGTRLYRPEQLAAFSSADGDEPAIRVIDGTTQMVAQEMVAANQGRVGLLNFASARNPGGGFLNGAKAQEEDLCRCSGLYPCLLQCMEYYEANRNQDSLLYLDFAIFSPNVPFFKTRGTGDLLPVPFRVSVITAPAPNSRPFLKTHPYGDRQLEQTFLRRWQNVLRIARDQRIQRLLLGAWGCGAFGGDPFMASQTAKKAIETDGAGIREIVFAIPDSGQQSKANFDAFKATFAWKLT